ncbi:hypothetical protein LIER_38176 [Lithospermum erythrorhizon]|uniref:HAT C-terminal dimerisation domain-containing protein n=1 Tax=Lithospermum erythrorhizon TaxID=34254 RepID=A0AAV3PYW8_LITER
MKRYYKVLPKNEEASGISSSSTDQREVLAANATTNVEAQPQYEIINNGIGFLTLAPVNVGDTRWADILVSLVKLFPHVILVLEKLQDIGASSGRNEARGLQYDMESFEFVFILHLMTKVLGIIPDLNDMLFSHDQSLLKALELGSITKKQLVEYRDDGWEEFFNEVASACDKWDLNVPHMNAECTKGLRTISQRPRISNLLHYKLNCFYDILDMQLKELDDRFNDENNELLSCIACLSPCKSFEDFDKKSLLRMTELYPHEFAGIDVAVLSDQFECYITDVRSDARFSGLQGIADYFRKLIQTKKHKAYPSVYLLLRLALVLPTAAPSVGRVFSATGFVKRQAKKRMFDQYMKNCLVTAVEMDLFDTISDDVIIDRFQSMKFR